MPVTAGILDIIYGAFGVIFGYFMVAIGGRSFVATGINLNGIVWGSLVFISGVLIIIGGFFVLFKKHWSTAITTAIASLILLIYFILYFVWDDIKIAIFIAVPVILAIIFTILSRKQFNSSTNT